MACWLRRSLLLAIVTLAVTASAAGPAGAAIEPPWCGTPVPDAAENLPDGTDPSDPPGAFPHIPVYAIGCTLESIAAASDGRMTVEVIGKSALGRDMYLVTINALDTPQRRKDFHAWQQVRRVALTDPAAGQRLVQRYGDDIKIPIFIQAGIHGNEYEGVDAAMQLIERLATTPAGADAEVDRILDHSVLVFNVIQNPDGRAAGTRANGNGFDLNRDYLTQSQSETRASITGMKRWLPPEVLDLHGYVTPTLIEATTKPHNPSIEYDLWLKWNQPRIDANEAAMASIGQAVTRPINDWCSDGNPAPASGICPDGRPPGPAVAEGWDDWGPFYAAMYAQHLGLDSSTVEMCQSVTICGGRDGARRAQYVISWSTMEFVVDHRDEMLFDELEIYRRGVAGAPRPACCPAPFDVDNNWMLEYPTAYVIPRGAGQRSDPEASRLVEWMLFNDVEVSEIKQDYRFGARTFEKGSYVIWMNQARRGLADTALRIGVDISDRISILYAPPAAWSHGYLWGADVETIPSGAEFSPLVNRILKPTHLPGGVEPGAAGRYALEIDSPTAVRTLNRLVGAGVPAELALASFDAASGAALPAGTAIFAADPATKNLLGATGRETGLRFQRVAEGDLPAAEELNHVPRIAVLTAAVNQDVWVLRQLGFTADPVSTGSLNTTPTDPLASYDVIFNVGSGYPGAASTTARARLQAFFARGGGYLGGQATGSNFLSAAAQVTGLAVASDSGGGSGYSGILLWDNTGGQDSVITGVYPSRDTLIADPPTWLTGVPATMTVDGRLPASGFFAAGLWPNHGASSAPGAAVIAHGTNTAATARLTLFASNPLYRADPEREWPMVGTAAYWASRPTGAAAAPAAPQAAATGQGGGARK
jgi:Zinc carboxypeptidase